MAKNFIKSKKYYFLCFFKANNFFCRRNRAALISFKLSFLIKLWYKRIIQILWLSTQNVSMYTQLNVNFRSTHRQAINKRLKLEKVYTESGQEQLNLLIFCFGGKVIFFENNYFSFFLQSQHLEKYTTFSNFTAIGIDWRFLGAMISLKKLKKNIIILLKNLVVY